MGKLLVIEGLDGSGKATQSEMLAEKLREEGRRVRKVSFPNYESPSSALIKMYLGGEFGSQPEDVNAFAASAFYAVDRYASYQTDWKDFYLDGGLVIADRYTTSNAIHQCAKLPAAEWGAYIDWLEDFEYARLGIPKPDRVVFLDVEPAVGQELAKQRGQPDIHEENLAYLKNCYDAALWCAGKLGWTRLACTEKGKMRPRQSIAEELYEKIRRIQ